MFEMKPIGHIEAARVVVEDDFWGGMEARIVLTDAVEPDALAGLEDFSHAEIIYVLDQVPPEKILVISDDTDLAPGRIRLKPGGGAGGRNGHKSIIQLLGTQEYPRLKIGIGRVEKDDTIDHVLGGFTVEERAVQDEALSRGEKTIRVLLSDGLEAAMNIANVG